ncbi:MAG: polysaccharide deacetylase family protein [Halorientalis sp.]
MSASIPDGHSFALCLTHDIDRPYKGLQAPYFALSDSRLHHLKALVPSVNPWWQFDRLRRIESDLGVRSACYFLQEPHLLTGRPPSQWTDPKFLIEQLGRYRLSDPAIKGEIRELAAGGWEIGVHGSIGSHRDVDRLRTEKHRIEDILDDCVIGIRQHHLELDVPQTWRRHREVGLRYDTSLGSASEVGFNEGYHPRRPFDDEFVVFPTTIMDKALASVSESNADAWDICESILEEARANDAVMTVLWHLRNFCERDYPGQGALYRRLIERAQEMDAWVGPPGELYATVSERPETVIHDRP